MSIQRNWRGAVSIANRKRVSVRCAEVDNRSNERCLLRQRWLGVLFEGHRRMRWSDRSQGYSRVLKAGDSPRTGERVLAVEGSTRFSNFWALTARSVIRKSWKSVEVVELWPGLSRRRHNRRMGLRQAKAKVPRTERWLRSGPQCQPAVLQNRRVPGTQRSRNAARDPVPPKAVLLTDRR